MADKSKPVLLAAEFSAMRRIIKILLEKLGYAEVIECDDGLKAMEVLKSKTVSAIIADKNLPHLLGLELLKAFKAAKASSAIPLILMMTPEEKGSDDGHTVDAGARILLKPFSAEVLDQALQ